MGKEKETWRERLELWMYQKYNITISADIIIISIVFLVASFLIASVLIIGLFDRDVSIESNFVGVYVSSDEEFVSRKKDVEYSNNITITDNINEVDEDILSNFSNAEFVEDTLYLSNGEQEYNYELNSKEFEYFTDEINLISYYDFVKESNKNEGFYIFINTDEIAKRPEYSKVIYSAISLNGYENAQTVLYNNNDNINVMFKDLAVTNPPLFLISYTDNEISSYVDNLSYMPFVSNKEKCTDKEDAMYSTISNINNFLAEYFNMAITVESNELPTPYCTSDNYTAAEWKDIQEAKGSDENE